MAKQRTGPSAFDPLGDAPLEAVSSPRVADIARAAAGEPLVVHGRDDWYHVLELCAFDLAELWFAVYRHENGRVGDE